MVMPGWNGAEFILQRSTSICEQFHGRPTWATSLAGGTPFLRKVLIGPILAFGSAVLPTILGDGKSIRSISRVSVGTLVNASKAV
jgi:hypothetical protein